MVYNKEVQTMIVEIQTPEAETEVGTTQRGVSEMNLEAIQAARDRELEEESIQLDKEIEEEIRGTIQLIFPFTLFS